VLPPALIDDVVGAPPIPPPVLAPPDPELDEAAPVSV